LSANDKPLQTTNQTIPMGQSPIPQYYNPATDAFEAIQGDGGAQNVRVEDGANEALGATTDAAASDSTSSWSLVSLLKGVWAKLEAIYTRLGDTLTVSGTVNVGNLPSTTTIDGSVSVSNFPATQAVSGTVATNTTIVSPIPAGTNIIGKTGIDQTANGVKNVDGSGTELFTAANPANVTLQASAASGAAVPSKIVQVGGVNSGNLYALTLDSANRLIATLPTVEGAAGQTAPAKFLMLGATDGTNAQALKVDANKALFVSATNVEGATGSTPPTKALQVGGKFLGTLQAFDLVRFTDRADGITGTDMGLAVVAGNYAYNGATWDRWRNNTEGTLLASAARTATTVSPDQTNYNHCGVLLYVNVTAASGTGGLTVRIAGKDPATGLYRYLNVAPTAITATGSYQFALSPSVAGGNVAQATSLRLPRTWRVEVTAGDGSSYTYSIGYALSV
jgi:hypothetical protein